MSDLNGFVYRLGKLLKDTKPKKLKNNVFFTQYRTVAGRRVRAGRKQQLRHLVVFGRS